MCLIVKAVTAKHCLLQTKQMRHVCLPDSFSKPSSDPHHYLSLTFLMNRGGCTLRSLIYYPMFWKVQKKSTFYPPGLLYVSKSCSASH